MTTALDPLIGQHGQPAWLDYPGLVTYPFGTAYEFTSSAEHRAYYDQWAREYDEGFAEHEGYDYPGRVAALLRALAVDGDTPVADIGCGTGLVGRALATLMPGTVVHGFDISPAMLEIASATGTYRSVTEIDLTSVDPTSMVMSGEFGAVVSAGAFTLGHLGPEVLRTVVWLGRPSALFVVGINGQHFAQADFASTLDGLRREGVIQPWEAVSVPIFGEPERVDLARMGSVAVFRRSP